MDITLDSLEALEAIAHHGSFARAARALNKVQSAVSYSVARAEDALGVALFDRSGHRAVLTPAGRVLLEEAREVLTRARRLQSTARRLATDCEPRLLIIVDGILPMASIMRVLKALADEGVPTRVQLRVEFLGGVQDRFERDDADLMLVKDFTPDAQLHAVPLPEIECLLVTAGHHALATRRGLTLSDLRDEVELTVHDSSTSKRLIDTHLFGGSRVFFLSDFGTKREALLLGLGFGWMPRALIDADLGAGRLVCLDYRPGARFTFTPHLVYPAARPPGAIGRRFLALSDPASERGVPVSAPSG